MHTLCVSEANTYTLCMFQKLTQAHFVYFRKAKGKNAYRLDTLSDDEPVEKDGAYVKY